MYLKDIVSREHDDPGTFDIGEDLLGFACLDGGLVIAHLSDLILCWQIDGCDDVEIKEYPSFLQRLAENSDNLFPIPTPW